VKSFIREMAEFLEEISMLLLPVFTVAVLVALLIDIVK
jgi:hypothetical protein